jgi:Mlc titration factor MtfA (ptsG expression regulator)
MFGWLKERRRRKILAEPFPQEWEILLARDVALWRTVPQALRERLRDDLRLFLAERSWEPCGGLALSEAMKALIAAQACVLTLGRSVEAFGHVRSVLVYPARYWAPGAEEDEAGVVTEGWEDLEGEAWERGIVVLSWADLKQDAKRMDGRNLVLHEFAHQLDLLDFLDAARPRSALERERYGRWRETFLRLYDGFCEAVDSGRKVKVLDEYGADEEAEFFAVATEAFFERGALLKTHHPELYGILNEYYDLDPASWPLPPEPPEGKEAKRKRRKG